MAERPRWLLASTAETGTGLVRHDFRLPHERTATVYLKGLQASVETVARIGELLADSAERRGPKRGG